MSTQNHGFLKKGLHFFVLSLPFHLHITIAFFSTEQDVKWVQSMSTNVKEALNNYHTPYTRVLCTIILFLLPFLSLCMLNNDRWLKCSVCSLLHTQHFDSLHWLTILCQCVFVYLRAWLNMLVPSSSVPLMVHSEVVQWWTVKYSAIFCFFSSTDSLRYPRTRKQQMNQGHIERKKNEREYLILFMHLISFCSVIIMFIFLYFCYIRQ